MDDNHFDLKAAQVWISTIESEKARVRDGDIYPRLRTWISRDSPGVILEIGCGQGACSDKIELEGRYYTGVDPSPFLLDRAKALYDAENRKFVSGSAYALPFSDGAFDAVFSVAVWHLLGDLQTAASELSRVLKSNGQFLLITANPDAYSAWTDHYTDTRIDGRRFEGNVVLEDGSVSRDVLYLHTLNEITASLLGANLVTEEIETFRNLILIRGRIGPQVHHR